MTGFAWTNVGALALEVSALVGRVAFEIEAEAKTLCPVDTGNLARSITTVEQSSAMNPTWVVGTNVYYAPWVEFGRGPVKPVRARMLRWEGKGGTVYAKSAGPAKAQPFLGPALESARARYG